MASTELDDLPEWLETRMKVTSDLFPDEYARGYVLGLDSAVLAPDA